MKQEALKIKLTGWKAVVAVVLVLGFLGFRVATVQKTPDDEASAKIRNRFQTEAVRQFMSDKGAAGDLSEMPMVKIKSMDARGHGKKMVVRVEILVDGKPPANGKPFRYFKMERSAMTGWRIVRETTSFSYYTTLF